MKKILLFIQLFVAVCLTACYTNVITDYEGEGDEVPQQPETKQPDIRDVFHSL